MNRYVVTTTVVIQHEVETEHPAKAMDKASTVLHSIMWLHDVAYAVTGQEVRSV